MYIYESSGSVQILGLVTNAQSRPVSSIQMFSLDNGTPVMHDSYMLLNISFYLLVLISKCSIGMYIDFLDCFAYVKSEEDDQDD